MQMLNVITITVSKMTRSVTANNKDE